MVRSTKLVSRANLLVFAALLAITVLFSALTWDRLAAAHESRAWSEHSYMVLNALKDLNLAVRDGETGQRGFLLTGNADYLAVYEAAPARIASLETELQALTDGDPEAQAQIHVLGPLVQRKMDELAQTIALERSGQKDAALALVRTDIGKQYMRQIEDLLTSMQAEQQHLLAARMQATNRRAAAVRWLTAAGSIGAWAALLWAAWMLNLAWRRTVSLEDEQRRSALLLRTSLDSLSQGVAAFDAAHLLTNWNDCFRVLLDLPDVALKVGAGYANLAAYVEGNAFLETEQQIEDAFEAGADATHFERQGPQGRLLEVRRTPMPDGGFVLTLSDISKRARAEAVLREAQKMQAVGQLTGGIAHDFNNLLTVILGNLEFARAKLTPDQAGLSTRLERAVWAAQRGATLTGQLLAFARKQPLAPAPVNLAATLPDLVPLLRRTLGEHIDVRFVDSAGLWPAMADPAQLESAVLNLALNARDAMPNGGRLTIELANKVLDHAYASAQAEVQAGDYVMVAVSDTGHGMTPDIAARVFEPFFTTKSDGKGTGLGLPMVFGFVKQSGGHLKLYSEPNEGTTLRMYLPRAIGPVPASPKMSAPLHVPRGTATILVVEDEAAVREIAVTILRDLGYDVLEAGDGEEGLRVFQANAERIDLLLTDVVLPGAIRGRQLADQATVIRPEIQVLFMSGYTENAIVHHGRLDDGVQLISKPFRREQLANRVSDMLARADGSNVVGLRQRQD